MKEHNDSDTVREDDLSQTAHRVAEVGRETASEAATYVRGSVDRAADYAQELTGVASEKITGVTGRPPDEWARQLRQFVEQSPIRALVVAIAAGSLVGRVMRHGCGRATTRVVAFQTRRTMTSVASRLHTTQSAGALSRRTIDRPATAPATRRTACRTDG